MRSAPLRAVLLLALSSPLSAAVTWRSIGPAEFGAMFGVAISPHDPRVIVAGLDMGNAFGTRDGGKSWQILGRNGGRPYANPAYRGTWGVCFDPKRPERVFIGSSHGLFRSTDGGESWRLVYGGGADWNTHAIAVDPANPDVVYAASGIAARHGVPWSRGQVQRSTDGGDTWTALGAGGPLAKAAVKGANWVTLAIDAQSPLTPRGCHRRVYLAGQSGFFVSDDAGDTWTSLEDRLPGGIDPAAKLGIDCRSICDLVVLPGEGHGVLFAAIVARYTDAAKTRGLGGVYRSDDGGQTWVERNHGLEQGLNAVVKGPNRYGLLATATNQGKVLYFANAAGVYKTDDAGETWRSVLDLKTVWQKARDADGKDIHWRLRDRGGNVDQSYYNAYGPANGLAVCPTNPDVVAYTDNAGMGLSVDGGAHWTEPGFEFGEPVWPGAFGDRPPMQLTHKVRSRGFQLIVPLDAAIDPFDPRTIAIGHCDTGLEISRDGGTWWEWAWKGLLGGERNYIRAVLYDPTVRGRMYVAGGGWGSAGHVYRSDDGGRTFAPIGIPQVTAAAATAKTPPFIHALALDPSSPPAARVLYAATDVGLFGTRDGGATWTPLTRGNGPVRKVLVDPTSPARVYAAGYEAAEGLYRSDDSGRTWTRLAADRIAGLKSLGICRATGTLYAVATAPGVPFGAWSPRALWRSDDHGSTWRKLDERLSSAVAVHPRNPDDLYLMIFAQDVTKDATNVLHSTDGGRTWTPVADDIPLSPGGDGNQLVFDPTDPSRLLLTHNSGTYEGRVR